MKPTCIILLISCWLVPVYAQDSDYQFVTDELTPERISVMQSALTFTELEDRIFWPMYQQYEEKRKNIDHSCNVFLLELKRDSSEQAMECSAQFFEAERAEIQLKKEYFDRINKALNGTAALQFLQTEALLELILKSKLYESKTWDAPNWTPGILYDEEVKLSMVEFSLGVTTQSIAAFRDLYEQYEFDMDRAVGHQLLWFQQYIERPYELTPGQCVKLGKSFINMQHDEIKIKEKYFKKMKDTFGPEFALRFIALEDYFGMMSKLKVWDTTVLAER